MRWMSLLVWLCLISLVAANDPCEQPTPDAMAKELGVKLPRRPWHLANIWWFFDGPVKNFESLEMDVTIDRDVPETYNLYVSPCGSSLINGLQFYGGLQTNVNGWVSGDEQTRVHRGHGAIFSRWSSDKKTPIGLEHVRKAADECLVESAGYEGEFASVRRPYAWKKGTYTWGIYKGETIERDGKPSTWFTCRVRNHANDEVTEVGSLLFEGTEFEFWNRHSAFVEVYSTSEIRRSNIPKVNVTFSRPRINGEKVPLKRAMAFYPDEAAGSTSSPDCAKVKADGEKAVVEVGAMFVRDPKQRRHGLDLTTAE